VFLDTPLRGAQRKKAGRRIFSHALRSMGGASVDNPENPSVFSVPSVAEVVLLFVPHKKNAAAPHSGLGSPACAVADQHPEPEVQGGHLPDFFRHIRRGTRTPKPLWSATRATSIGSKSIWPGQTLQGKLWTVQRRDARGGKPDCGPARTAWPAPPSPGRWPSPCAGFYAWFPRCQSRRPSSTGTRA